MTGYQQAVLYLSGSWSDGKYLVRNADRWYIDAVADLFPAQPYFQRRPEAAKRDYWCIKSAAVSPPSLSDVSDWQGFSRAFVELQGSLDLWPHKNRRGETIRTPRLRLYGQPDVLNFVAQHLPAGRKKLQVCRTQTGTTSLYAYQSPAEVDAILESLDGSPRNDRIWSAWQSILFDWRSL